MGQYFALHDAALWEATIAETLEPSIWSNVRHSPLSLSQRLLLERPGRVSYEFPHGMRHGTNIIQVSESTTVSLLVAFEEEAGRLFAGVLLKSRDPEEQPHYYCREMEEVQLTHPTATATAAANASGATSPGAPSDATQLPSELQGRTSPISPKAQGSRAAGRLSPSPEGGSGLLIEQAFESTTPMQRVEYPYILLYEVKEGILVFFSHDVEGCEEVVREIAHSYGHSPPLPQDLPPSQTSERSLGAPMGPGPGTQAASALASALKVKCVQHEVGRAPPGVTKSITELIRSDLQRRFAVQCDAEEQSGHTNCVVFCLRAMMALQLSVRGYDIRRVCESRADLGSKSGEAACGAWEQLWRRVRA